MKTSKMTDNPTPNNSSILFDGKNAESSPVFSYPNNRSFFAEETREMNAITLIFQINTNLRIKHVKFTFSTNFI